MLKKLLLKTITAGFVFGAALVPGTGTQLANAQDTADDAALKRGKILFLRCRSCHSVNAEDPHKVGPNLHGIVGAASGSKSGFTYSDALASGKISWTEEALNSFIAKPASFAPGTRMAFVGLPRDRDRTALIAYIKSVTR